MIFWYMLSGLLVGRGLNWAGNALPHLAYARRDLNRRERSPWLDEAVMIFMAALFSYLGLRFGLSWSLVGIALSCSFFVLMALIDLKYRLVPNILVYPALLLALLFHLLFSEQNVTIFLLGGAMAFSVFFFTAWLRPGDLGGGDVKLATLIGLVLGFPQVLWALLVGATVGALTAVSLLLFSRIQNGRSWTRKSHIPYAPFLCLGAIVALLYNPFTQFFPR